MDMLQAVLMHINNWFERETHIGGFAVSNGVLSPNPGIQDGQYFRIVGSVFNDGLHKWPTRLLADESFAGEVRALAVPQEIVNLSLEIAQWCEDNEKSVSSPYSAESFGGYSYQRESGGEGAAKYEGGDAWKAHFRSSLNAWRKL